METRHERRDGILIFTAVGRVDGVTSAAFESALVTLLASREERAVLDLTGVDYVNSAGLRVLLKAAKHLSGKGALVLCGLQPPVQQLLELAGLDKLFVSEPTLERALARLTPAT